MLKGPIYHTVQMLQLLHDANEATFTGLAAGLQGVAKRALQLDQFYNEDLCSTLVFKDEYQTWQKRLEEPASMPASVSVVPVVCSSV